MRTDCIYCSCSKGRWGSCCTDGKCKARFREEGDGSLPLPALRPGEPGYKQPPLINVSRYKFVMIDILHMYLRVTDQFLVRCCYFMDKRQIDEFMCVCRHHNLSTFHLRDENGKLRFSNLDKAKREKMKVAEQVTVLGSLPRLACATHGVPWERTAAFHLEGRLVHQLPSEVYKVCWGRQLTRMFGGRSSCFEGCTRWYAEDRIHLPPPPGVLQAGRLVRVPSLAQDVGSG